MPLGKGKDAHQAAGALGVLLWRGGKLETIKSPLAGMPPKKGARKSAPPVPEEPASGSAEWHKVCFHDYFDVFRLIATILFPHRPPPHFVGFEMFCQAQGNEQFKIGNYAGAIEHYTSVRI